MSSPLSYPVRGLTSSAAPLLHRNLSAHNLIHNPNQNLSRETLVALRDRLGASTASSPAMARAAAAPGFASRPLRTVDPFHYQPRHSLTLDPSHHVGQGLGPTHRRLPWRQLRSRLLTPLLHPLPAHPAPLTLFSTPPPLDAHTPLSNANTYLRPKYSPPFAPTLAPASAGMTPNATKG